MKERTVEMKVVYLFWDLGFGRFFPLNGPYLIDPSMRAMRTFQDTKGQNLMKGLPNAYSMLH